MLTARAITVRIGHCPIVDRASLQVASGQCVGLLGPNGAGKSTLLRALAGVIAHEGEVLLGDRPTDGLSATQRARLCAYLPQERSIAWPMAVADVVALARLPHGSDPGRLSPADTAAMARAMKDTGIAGIAGRSSAVLSGGETARVLLARALAVEAPLLLADEPVAGLDPMQQLAVMSILKQRAAGGTAVLTVQHDLTLAMRFCDRVIVLDGGGIVADGAPAAVLEQALVDRVFGIEPLVGRHRQEDWMLPWRVTRGAT